ncbi:MAG: ribulose-phosphate 3-epimerase [Candidatus Hydrogenedentes bacterium]|nr:ribulose-phosphate 3-epimerase [Candidatus Hydrogenedentota bacterium]
MVKCSTSLWSADLANLEAETKRVEPYSERFHIDVADGHYTPTLLFFPDLLKAVRRHTTRPLEVHLMCTHPLNWLEPFVEAGADGFIVYPDSENDTRTVIDAILSHGKFAGISLGLDQPLEILAPFWDDLSIVCILGTRVGIKGADMDPGVPDKIRAAKRTIADRGLKAEVEADGGIRRHSVPLMAAAGVDYIVPGSLMFGEEPARMRAWLGGLT